MKETIIEELLERFEVFPLVKGTVVTADPNSGLEIDCENPATTAICPPSHSGGLTGGEEGLFFARKIFEDGTLLLSYQKAIEFESLYCAAVSNEIHYAAQTAPDDHLDGVRLSLGQGALSEVVGVLPSWAATGLDLANQIEGKLAVSVIGFLVKEEQSFALLSSDKARRRSNPQTKVSGDTSPEELERYRLFLRKGGFMLGKVKTFAEQNAVIEFDLGVSGLLSLQDLQEGEELAAGQPIGVLVKENSEQGLLLTRAPLAVLDFDRYP